MGFWIFILIMNAVTPFTMIGFGKMFLKSIPREINGGFGYRTSMSMKNKDTWEFAHKYCGRLWYVCGWILLPLSVIPMLFVIGMNEDIVGGLGGVILIIQMILLIGSIFPTEWALRKTFDESGRRR